MSGAYNSRYLNPLSTSSGTSGSGTSHQASSMPLITSNVFPSRPPILRNNSSQSYSSSYQGENELSSSGYSHAATNQVSTFAAVPKSARSARVDFSPPLPPVAQFLLMNDPPPNVNKNNSSTVSLLTTSVNQLNLPSNDSDSRQKENEEPLKISQARNSGTKGKKGLAAMIQGLSSKKSNLQPHETTAVPNLRSDQEPVKLQLKSALANRNRTGKIDSKTTANELPTSWAAYNSRYAKGEIDIEFPPNPPLVTFQKQFPSPNFPSAYLTPFEAQNYAAPFSPVEPLRQRLLSRLNLFGFNPSVLASYSLQPSSASMRTTTSDSLFGTRRGSNDSTAASSVSHSAKIPSSNLLPPPHLAASPNLNVQNHVPGCIKYHPGLMEIIDHARRLFHTKIAIISVLEHDKQKFLACGGLPKGVEELPRDSSLDSHAILNGERGLVVLDMTSDWRFRNNILSAALNAKFYASACIFGASHADLEEEAGQRIAIGMISILDDQRRHEFSKSDRAQLRLLAGRASEEIQAFTNSQRRPSLASSTTSSRRGVGAQQATSSYTPNATYAPSPPPNFSLPATPVTMIRTRSEEREGKNILSNGSLGPATLGTTNLPTMPEESVAPTPRTQLSNKSNTTPSVKNHPTQTKPGAPLLASPAVTTHSTASPDTSPHHKLYHKACQAVGTNLLLDLVYLVSLNVQENSSEGANLRLEASFNLPNQKPSFDPNLHLKALKAPEGGLLYKNPALSKTGTRMQSGEKANSGYASGLLLPCCEEDGKGWVLGAFTRDSKREFSEEELSYVSQMCEQLGKVVKLSIRR